MLSDKVVHMCDGAWRERCAHFRRISQETGEARVDSLAHSVALHDWLEHQKALAALGARLFQAIHDANTRNKLVPACTTHEMTLALRALLH